MANILHRMTTCKRSSKFVSQEPNFFSRQRTPGFGGTIELNIVFLSFKLQVRFTWRYSFFSPDTRDVHSTNGRAETQTVSRHSLEVWCQQTSPWGQSPIGLSHRQDFLNLQEASKQKLNFLNYTVGIKLRPNLLHKLFCPLRLHKWTVLFRYGSPLPDFIRWGPGYKSVYYGINNTRPIYSERAH